MYKHRDRKTLSEIVREWDSLAPLRHEQLMSGRDTTFHSLLAPAVLEYALRMKARRILDVGCGTGVLTQLLGDVAAQVVGIDPSHVSIRIAQQLTRHPGVELVNLTLEAFVRQNIGPKFDLVVANMVLHDVLELKCFLSAAREITREGGTLLFSIPHPCFFPQVYGYANEGWFTYDRELVVEGEFKTSTYVTDRISTHVHRPLGLYLRRLREAGFELRSFEEVSPVPRTSGEQGITPPRYFILGTCSAVTTVSLER